MKKLVCNVTTVWYSKVHSKSANHFLFFLHFPLHWLEQLLFASSALYLPIDEPWTSLASDKAWVVSWLLLQRPFMQIGLDEWISFENVVLKIPSSSMVRSDCIVFMEPDVEGAYSLSGPSWSGISSSSPTWLPSLASLLSGLIALSKI